MSIQPPPNIMKAGERPAKIRTGARTATKAQERETLEKFGALAQDPTVLLPEWLGSGRSPFEKHARKLARVQALIEKPRRLRWAARGKRLWNGYAATLVVYKNQKIPSFAAIKFQGREVKFVYRTGTGRQALIGVQHHDDPEVRLLGYTKEVEKHRMYLVSGNSRFVAHPIGFPTPLDLLAELFADHEVPMRTDARTLKCLHAEGTQARLSFGIADLDAELEICKNCLKTIKDSAATFLDRRVLGPRKQLPIKRRLAGPLFNIRPEASKPFYEELAAAAFQKAERQANEDYASYSDVELLQWTQERLVADLAAREGGYLLVAGDLWLTGYEEAADAYVDSDLERRALKAAFRRRPPRLKTSDRSLTKILEPHWSEHGAHILEELAGGVLKAEEVAQLARLTPSEALSGLARILGARERFKEYGKFQDLDPTLDFVVTCLQIQRAGEHRVLLERLQAGSKDPKLRALALALARGMGERAAIEWQYAPHEKDAASFLEPYAREVASASPQKLGEALDNLAAALGVPKPTRVQ